MKNYRIIPFLLLICLLACMCASAHAASTLSITSHDNWEVVSWDDSFKLKWNSVTGASGYYLAIKNDSTGEYYVQNKYTTGTSFTATSYLPESGVRLKIWVGAVPSKDTLPVNAFTSQIIYVVLSHEPDVTISGSSSITESSAVLQMSVDKDHGQAIEDCGFYIGTSSTKSKMTQYSFHDYSTSYGATSKGTKYMTIPELKSGTKYYYRAYAVNAAGETYTSYKAFTTAKGSLDKPVITAPTDEAVYYTGSSIRLQWNAVSGADGYKYYIKQLSGEPNRTNDNEPYIRMWDGSTTSRSYTLAADNLVPGYWYKFVVEAYASDAGSGWSKWVYVYIEKGTLEKAEIISPDNTATYPGGQSILFDWEPVDGAEKYTYFIKQLSGIPDRTNDNEPSIGDPWTKTITSTSCTLSASDVVPGYWYKFVVEATAENMNASWSEWIYCYVDELQLEDPEIITPTEWTDIYDSESILVDWDSVSGADGYICHIKQLIGEPDTSNNNEPAVASWKPDCGSTSKYTLSSSNVHGGYWYKFVVEAYAKGAPSSWSDWIYVYVPENGTLERAVITAPTDTKDYTWGEDILFTWSKVPNATRYTYYVKQLKGEPNYKSTEDAYQTWTGTTSASRRYFTLPGDQVLPDVWYKFVVQAEADGYDPSWSYYTYVHIPDREDWTHAVLDGAFFSIDEEGFASNGLLRTFDASKSKLEIIGSRAFDSCVNLRAIFLPETVVTIADDAFINCPQLVIHCYAGSPVHEYAERKNIPVVLHRLVENTDMLRLSQDSWIIGASEAAQRVIRVNSSEKWTASSNASWLTLSASSGASGTNVVLSASENTTKSTRTATVSFVCGKAKAEVTVSQSGTSGKECALDLHPDYWEPASGALTREIVVEHEDGFTVSSNKSWLTWTVNNATVTAKVSASALNSSSTGILTITCDDCGAEKTVTVAIKQQVVPTPTTLRTSSNEPHAIKLTWKAVSGASYIIEHSSDGSTWKEIATADVGTTAYTHGDANVIGASSTHWYRVTACKVINGKSVRSEPSAKVSGTSIAEAVLDFTGVVGNIGDNGRTSLSSLTSLSWTPMSDVTYRLTIKDTTSGSYVNGLKPANIGSGSSYSLTGLLTEGHTYQIWVGAVNGYDRIMGQSKVRTFSVIRSSAAKPTIKINSVSPASVSNSGNNQVTVSMTFSGASVLYLELLRNGTPVSFSDEWVGVTQERMYNSDDFLCGGAANMEAKSWTKSVSITILKDTAVGDYSLRVTAVGEGGNATGSAAIAVTEPPASTFPDSLYVAQNGSTTCTLASTVMMMRARAYLSGCSVWSSITEAAVKPTAWLSGQGLYNSFTYSFSGNKISVDSNSTGGSISAATLKSLLDKHPEGIVLYVYDKPHAVFITGYSGDTFYCADPVSSYSGKQITLDSCSIAKYYNWTQAQLLANADKYWYVSSCSISSSPSSALTKEKMMANLTSSTYFGGKKEAVLLLADEMWDNGFSPAFIAGTLANIYAEGSVGLFENIMGYTQSRLLAVYPNLKKVSESGVAHKNYIAHMKGFTDYDSCGHSHTDYSPFSNKYIYNGISLSAVDALLEKYKAESWHAQFGLGTVQWTADRTISLMTFYHAEAGSADTITYEQCLAAEMKCVNWELLGSKYWVFSKWLNNNTGALDTSDAAYDAGYRVARDYECPGNTDQYPIRGGYARDIYSIMTGQ